MTRIIEKDLSFKIVGLCFQTHKILGRFAREKQYADKFEDLLKVNQIHYLREPEIKNLKTGSPKGNRPDFIIEKTVIVDFKAKNFVNKEDYYQMQRYLVSAYMELGLIINFRAYRLSPKRILNSSYSGHSDKNSGN